MKAKLMNLLAGGVVLTVILLTSYQPVTAAPPTGEVKTAVADLGSGIPIPYIERTHAMDWMGLLYDPLVGCTPEGKLSPDWGLANKWEMSPDGITWTFYLRKGIKFHNGVELTAKDVKFSIEQNMLPDAVEYYFIKEYVKNIETKEPYTIVIHCKKPVIYMAHFLSHIMGSGGMVVSKDYYERLGRDEFAKRPIGTGPYKWHSQMTGSFIKLEATDKHWRDGVPRYKYMTFLTIPEESTRMAMLKTGEADIASIGREVVKDALSAGLNVVSKENAAVLTFQPNMQWTSPVFSDIRFRKALNLAIDKEAIIKKIFVGMASPLAVFPGSHMFGFGPELRTLKPYPYDPDEARRLIKEGGWEGHEFIMPSYERAKCPEFHQVVEAVAGYWEKVGLKPKIRMTEWAVWRKAYAARKTQNSIHATDSPMNPDIVTVLERVSDRWDFSVPRSSVNTPELTERFKRIRESLDIAEISRLLTEICRYAYDHYLTISICEMPDMIATTKNIPKWNLGVHRTGNNYYDLIRQR